MAQLDRVPRMVCKDLLGHRGDTSRIHDVPNFELGADRAVFAFGLELHLTFGIPAIQIAATDLAQKSYRIPIVFLSQEVAPLSGVTLR